MFFRLDTGDVSSVLLVVGVQGSSRQRPSWQLLSNPKIVEQVNRLVAVARANEDLGVGVLHTEPGTGDVFDPAAGHVRPVEGLRRAEDDPVLTKTEQCCETTARLASDLGYAVDFVIDATATTPSLPREVPEPSTNDELLAEPRTLRVEEIIARTEYALSGRFATISAVDELESAGVGSG